AHARGRPRQSLLAALRPHYQAADLSGNVSNPSRGHHHRGSGTRPVPRHRGFSRGRRTLRREAATELHRSIVAPQAAQPRTITTERDAGSARTPGLIGRMSRSSVALIELRKRYGRMKMRAKLACVVVGALSVAIMGGAPA